VGTHNITQDSLAQGNNTYSLPPPPITVQQESSMLGEMYNVLQQMKLVSDRLVDSSRKHTSGLQDISHDYNRNQDHRSDRTMSLSHHTHRQRQPTTHNRHRRRRATTKRRRGDCDRYYSPTDESDEYSQTEVDEPQVTHSSHEDRLDDNRRTPPRVSPIRKGINMDMQQDRRYFMRMYKSLKYTGKTS